ncbi:MAG: hypothetical protein Q4A74_06700 [Cardiobacteriaceae bacterium]|nr:hypothetical protein [Cardiobacteriaceae bacterium]
MKILITLAFAVLGVVIVRLFLLNEIEQVGWAIFWHEFFDGKVTGGDMRTVFSSNTFMKCCAGFIIGGIAGIFASNKLINKDN